MLEQGQGVEKDDGQAALLFRQAADGGFVMAQFKLGAMYRVGLGVPRDYSTAVMWLRKAAEHKYTPAYQLLGLMFADGEGVAKDYVEAQRLFHLAADQGDVLSQRLLGLMYANGGGAEQSVEKAIYWYSKAAAGGDSEAQRQLNELFADVNTARAAQNAANFALRSAVAAGKSSEQAWRESSQAAGHAALEAGLAAGRSVASANRAARQVEDQVATQRPKGNQKYSSPRGDGSADAGIAVTKSPAGADQSDAAAAYELTGEETEKDYLTLQQSGERLLAAAGITSKYSISVWTRSLDVTINSLSVDAASVLGMKACDHGTDLHKEWTIRVFLMDGRLGSQCKLQIHAVDAARFKTAVESFEKNFDKELRERPWMEGYLRAMGINLRQGPIPELSPAEKMCSEIINDPSKGDRDLDGCIEHLRMEWLQNK
jgi:hypothetical protein